MIDLETYLLKYGLQIHSNFNFNAPLAAHKHGNVSVIVILRHRYKLYCICYFAFYSHMVFGDIEKINYEKRKKKKEDYSTSPLWFWGHSHSQGHFKECSNTLMKHNLNDTDDIWIPVITNNYYF